MQLFRLVAPAAAVTLASMIMLAATAMLFARSQDETASAAERQLLNAWTARLPSNLEIFAEENTWWDPAVENLVLTENLDWAEETVGASVVASEEVDGVFILAPDERLIYESHKLEGGPRAGAFLNGGLRAGINGLVPVAGDVGVRTNGFALVDGRLYAFGISMVQPAGLRIYDPPLVAERRPTLTFYREIDTETLQQLAEETSLESLTFTPGAEPVGETALTLDGLTGDPIGSFSWQGYKPGRVLLTQMVWPALLFLLMLTGASVLFVRRAQATVAGLATADRAKTEFLASMSHELRTPLNAIVGFADMLRMGYYGEITGVKNKEYVDIIHTSGTHLLAIVDDILDFSKVEAGKISVEYRDFDPKPVAEECISIVEPFGSDKNIVIVWRLESTSIHSDPRIMRQTLINILTNAIKYTAEGGQVAVFGELLNDVYRVIVSDTGVGMTPEEVAEAKKMFSRVGEGADINLAGAGLGLPLAERFMRLLGGSLGILSVPGQGTSITLDFPLAAPKEDSADPAQQ